MLLLVALALAQDPLPPLVEEPVAWHEGFTWRGADRALGSAGQFTSIAVDPFNASRAMAVDLGGGVWLSEDGARSWTHVLDPAIDSPYALEEAPAPDEEELLLEAEATADDFSDVDINQDAVDLSGNLDDVDKMAERAQAPALRLGGVVWFHPTRPGQVLVSQAEGLWSSTDGGYSWRQESDIGSVTVFAAGPTGEVVAGTNDGLRYSPDMGVTWIEILGSLDGVKIQDLSWSELDATWYAATESGLYASTDAQVWRQVSKQIDLRAVLADPAWKGGLWLVTSTEILRSDDGGRTTVRLSRHPLMGTQRLILGPDPGHLLLCGSDGAWESMDGGTTWKPLNDGMPGPEVKDIALMDGVPVAATLYGIFRLERTEKPIAAPARADIPPLQPLVDAALARPGMDPVNVLQVARAQTVRRVMPQVQLDADVRDGQDWMADFSTRTNPGALGAVWQVGVSVNWGSGADVYDVASYDPDFVGDDLFVIGDEVFSEGNVALAAANVAQQSTAYRQRVSTNVAEAWYSLERARLEEAELPPDDLRARTHHAIKVQELEAQLDALTDGAYTASKTQGESQ